MSGNPITLARERGAEVFGEIFRSGDRFPQSPTVAREKLARVVGALEAFGRGVLLFEIDARELFGVLVRLWSCRSGNRELSPISDLILTKG